MWVSGSTPPLEVAPRGAGDPLFDEWIRSKSTLLFSEWLAERQRLATLKRQASPTSGRELVALVRSGPDAGKRVVAISSSKGMPPAPAATLSDFDRNGVRVVALGGRHRRRARASISAEQLGDYDLVTGDYLGFSLGKLAKNVGKAIGKGVVDTGHAVGKAATSKVGQLVTGAAIAASGVGILPALAIGAGVKAGGRAIAPGGNLKNVANAGVQGAVVGAAGYGTGKVVRAVGGKIADKRAGDQARRIAAEEGTPAPVQPDQQLVDQFLEKPATVAPASPMVARTTGRRMKVDTAANAAAEDRARADAATADAAARAQANADAKARADAAARAEAKKPKPGTGRRMKPTDPDATDGSDKLDVAKKVIGAGTAAKSGANKAADKIDALAKRGDQIRRAAAAAEQAGDAVGFSQLTDLAQQLQRQVTDAQSAANDAASSVRQAGAAAQGAAAGAVAGSAASSISDFFAEHKTMILLSGVTVAAIVVLPRVLSSSPARRAA